MNGNDNNVVAIALAIVVFLALGGAAAGIYFGLKHFATASQAKALSGLEVFSQPKPGLVGVVFHTYYGFLAYFTQTEYRFWAEPEVAKIALWRLHRFNLIWGWFAAGALFIPLMSIGNYWAQSRSIRRQVEEMNGKKPVPKKNVEGF